MGKINFSYFFYFVDKPFLLFDKEYRRDRVIVFGLESHINILKQAVFWQVHGTFDIVPNCFRQLLTIHAPLSNDEDAPVVPCLYVLMTSKTSSLYKKTFKMLKRKIETQPTFIFCDFEIGLVNGLKKIFSESTIKGCNVHLRRIIWRKIQSLGYRKKYLKNIKFSKTIKLIGALAYFDPDNIMAVFDEVRVKLKKAPELVKWFHKNYIGK